MRLLVSYLWRSVALPIRVAGFPIPPGLILQFVLVLLVGSSSGNGEKVLRFYIPMGPLMPLELTLVQTLVVLLMALLLVIGLVVTYVRDQLTAQQTIRNLTTLEPLRAARVDPDSPFLRLIVENPNSLGCPNSYARLVSAEIVSTPVPRPRLPPLGYRFPRSTYEGGGLRFPIGSRSSVPVDIAFTGDLWSEFLLPTMALDTPQQVSTGWRLPVGTYRLKIELGSESATISPTLANVRVSFQGGLELMAELESAEV